MVIGNLGKDPEIRYTGSGAAVCNFSLATNEVWFDKDKQKQERVEWHNIVVWGRQAESCAKYLAKGRSVYVEGRIQTRSWEGTDGAKKYMTEIVAEQVKFLGGGNGERREQSQGGGGWSKPAQSKPINPPGGGWGTEPKKQVHIDDDSIPF